MKTTITIIADIPNDPTTTSTLLSAIQEDMEEVGCNISTVSLSGENLTIRTSFKKIHEEEIVDAEFTDIEPTLLLDGQTNEIIKK